VERGIARQASVASASSRTAKGKKPAAAKNSSPSTANEPAATTNPQETASPAELKRIRQQEVEKADFEHTKDMFRGLGGESYIPNDEAQYEELAVIITEKVSQFKSSYHYLNFLKSLLRKLTTGIRTEDLKDISSTINALYNEALKSDKKKTKKTTSTKPAVKATKTNSTWAEEEMANEDLQDDFSAYS